MLNKEQRELVLNNMRLVYRVAVDKGKMYDEDALQCGFVGLCRAAEKYDASRGIQFSTFAVSYINWWLNGTHSDMIYRKRLNSGDMYFADNLEEYDVADSREGDKRELQELLLSTDDSAKEILHLMYLGYNKYQISKKMSISPKKLNKELDKVREKFKDDKKSK